MAKTSNIPSGLIPEKEIDRTIEMRAFLGLPFHFGKIKIQPVTLGSLSLLEFAAVDVFRSADWSDLYGMAMMIWIVNNGKAAAELVLDYRDYHETHPDAQRFGINYRLYDELSEVEQIKYLADKQKFAHALDTRVLEFIEAENLFSPDFNNENCLKLFNYIYSSFNGGEMLPHKNKKKSAWFFDAPALASGIYAACSSLNIDYDAAIWQVPACAVFHACTASAVANGAEHVSRPPDIEFLKEYSRRTVNRELAGQLNLWQLREPVYYELSRMQAEKGGAALQLKYGSLKKEFTEMSKEQKTAHFEKYNKLIEEERAEVYAAINGGERCRS